MTITLSDLRARDADDALGEFRHRFHLPAGITYLDGNSLGALPLRTAGRMREVLAQEWGEELIRSWSSHDWIGAPQRVGGKIAGLIGAQPHEVVVADSTSVNLYKLIMAALAANPGRTVILSEPGGFPTDLYVAQGALAALGGEGRLVLRTRDDIAEAIDGDCALVLLTHVHYKTADMFDMAAITARAHAAGALVLWDLSHSAGAVPLDLDAAGVDLAVGCGYKYLNGGPGAPSFLFVAERHQDRLASPLSGWMGHSQPFDFVDDYRPAPGISRFLCGTPPILGIAALDVGVDLLLEARMPRIAAKSAELCRLFIELVEQECGGHGLELVGPRAGSVRGSHVSFAHSEGYAIMQALIERGVIGDFRAPDIVRFGLTPLYVGFEDIWRAVATLRQVLEARLWDNPAYRVRAAVT